MQPPRLLQTVADSPSLLALAATLEAICTAVVLRLVVRSLKEDFGTNEDIPDAWFGCTPDRLHAYFDALGPDGRRAYITMSLVDFVPCMPAYTIFFGALLVRLSRGARTPTHVVSWLFPMAMAADAVETSIFGWAARAYPERLDPWLIAAASWANQAKWTCVGTGLAAMAVLLVVNVQSYARGKSRRKAE